MGDTANRDDKMWRIRTTLTTLIMGLAPMLPAGMAGAAELRVLSVGSVQIAAGAAAEFTKATGDAVALSPSRPRTSPRGSRGRATTW